MELTVHHRQQLKKKGVFRMARRLVPKLKWKIKLLIVLLVLACGVGIAGKVWVQPEAFSALARIDPLPHTRDLVAQERYAEAHEYLSFFMEYEYVSGNPDARALYRQIESQRRQARYRLAKVAEGVARGWSDETEGQVAAVVSDFFVIGDVRDLTLEGAKWTRGEEVDELTAALSALGLAASAGSWLTAGGTLSAKPALSVLKTAEKAGDVPPWARKELIRSAKLFTQTKRLDRAAELFDTLHDLVKTGGLRGALKALNNADDLKSLKRLAAFSKRFGTRTATLLELTGDAGRAAWKRLDDVPAALCLEAATFGKPGIDALAKTGPDRFKRFLRFSRLTARSAKITYKHHDALAAWLWWGITRSIGRLPLWALLMIAAGGTLIVWRW